MSYPIISSNLYDNTSRLYDVSRIVNEDLSFNLTMYESYSPVIMTPYFAITYGTSFMAVIAAFIHVALYYGADIWLIAKTRCSRRMRCVQESGIAESLQGFLGSPIADSSLENESAALPAATLSVGVREPAAELVSGFGQGCGPTTGRRNSDTVLFKKDGIIRPRQFSLQLGSFSMPTLQENSTAAAAAPRCSKTVVDDRAQIPTEMFGKEDIHTTLMRAYPEIPGWWFGSIFVICFAMAVMVCRASEIQLPVYALVLALILAAAFAIPMAIIEALSSTQIGLNVLSEVVCGYLLPGDQLGNSIFKCYSYMALYQCLNLTQGFKLGHYMKVPPRKILIVVIYGTLVGAVVKIQFMEWLLLYNRKELLDASPRSGWSLRNLSLFFSASLLWGAISPKRLFAEGSIYHFLPYCFLIGIVLPVPFYIMHRYYPPYGAMCKGNSIFPFMPKCRCPTSHIAASSEDDGLSTTAIYTATFHGDRHDKTLFDSENNTKRERSCASRIFGQCWSFRDRGHQDQGEDKEMSPDQVASGGGGGGGGTCETNLDNDSSEENSIESSDRSIASDDPIIAEFQRDSSSSSSTSFSSTQVPHLYYSNSDSTLNYHLRRFPWHLINTPLICAGASFVPQAPASFVVSAGIVSFCFAFLVLRYHHEWWRRYTFVLAAALDAGTQICNMTIFVIFSLILRGAVEFPNWFGNDALNVEKCGVGDGYN
ncbi:hypothetical protein BGZ65_011028 [Modicella reniformis]|uniref:Uncharacterized protein n=1 Tax=Modicella reniformis TaxID=1440133 RepID=A0A9P6J3W9_9FUNG|nr:hypothetical protein BGZ65_011028 [Modicella reniformis]